MNSATSVPLLDFEVMQSEQFWSFWGGKPGSSLLSGSSVVKIRLYMEYLSIERLPRHW